MKKVIILFLISAIFILPACKNISTPNPPNAFTITSINTHGDNGKADLSALASYQNYEGKVYVGGEVDYGDGTVVAVDAPDSYIADKGTGVWESHRFQYRYATKGVYTVTVKLVVHFQSGDVKSEKTIQLEIK